MEILVLMLAYYVFSRIAFASFLLELEFVADISDPDFYLVIFVPFVGEALMFIILGVLFVVCILVRILALRIAIGTRFGYYE